MSRQSNIKLKVKLQSLETESSTTFLKVIKLSSPHSPVSLEPSTLQSLKARFYKNKKKIKQCNSSRVQDSKNTVQNVPGRISRCNAVCCYIGTEIWINICTYKYQDGVVPLITAPDSANSTTLHRKINLFAIHHFKLQKLWVKTGVGLEYLVT